MRLFDAAQTACLLPYGPLAQAVARTLARKFQGLVDAPERLGTPLPGGAVLLAMPASDGEIAVIKLVTVHPGNPALGLPLIQGEVVALDAATGERLAILDGPTLTARRTAAASLLAAQLLAPQPGGPLLVIGAGVQAKAHAEAFVTELGGREVFIASRNPFAAEALANHLRGLGAEALALVDQDRGPDRALDRALQRSTVIVTATASPTPVLPENVRTDAFIAAVGSFRPAEAEIPAALVRRCALYVDSLEGARTEAGDLLLAGVDWSRVTPLERVVAGLPLAGGTHGAGPVLYKSVGHAALDLAAARLALGVS